MTSTLLGVTILSIIAMLFTWGFVYLVLWGLDLLRAQRVEKEDIPEIQKTEHWYNQGEDE